ncbi:MAG: peptidylprolyl isomerase [Xanthobacteraceae bacterium]|nr:peptidylprolyl isomerase [Xanthobacteraceae bacterium]
MTRPIESRGVALRLSAFAFLAAMLVAALVAAWPVAPAQAQAQSDKVVAKVAGVEIRESDLAMAEEDMGQQVQQLEGAAKRDALVAYVADVIVAAKAAEAKKITDQKDFKSRIAFIRNKLAMEMLLVQEGKAAATDAAMKKVYEEAVKQQGNEQEVRARHILVPTEDEAKTILAEIRKGTDFAEMAKQKSKDPGAAAEGGDLGYFTKDQMVPEFADQAFKMNKGDVSEPVKSQFGWHIIKVEDKRTKPAPTFDQVKEQVEQYVTRRAQADYITKLRETAKVERLDKK